MKINTAVVLIYRRFAFGILALFFGGVVSYVGLVMFYAVSNSWATPLVLSPSQSKVLNFQPQVAALVLNINKQKSELLNAMNTKQSIVEQLAQIDILAEKLNKTILVEKSRTANTAYSARNIVNNKKVNIKDTNVTVSVVRELEKQTDAELKAGLITSDQAAQRKISLQSAVNAYTELKASTASMEAEANLLKDYSDTLGGDTRSLSALTPTKQLMDLAALKSQLRLQLDSGERNVDIIKKSMATDNRILQVAMDSPYYSALWNPTPVVFVPYDNLSGVLRGTKVFDCILQILICREVGTIDRIFDAEEYGKHPLFKSDVRGKFASVTFEDKTAVRSLVLFLGSKPLFI